MDRQEQHPEVTSQPIATRGNAIATVRALDVHTAVGKGRSRPLIVRADDGYDYVVKMRIDPKTARFHIAELLAWQIGAVMGISQPRIALVLIEPDVPTIELEAAKDVELRSSEGYVFGSRMIQGAMPMRRARDSPVPPDAAADIIWFDSLLLNSDRKWRNPNILVTDVGYYVIDNDSAFHPHHRWAKRARWSSYGYSPISGLTWWSKVDHVLLPWASSIADAGNRLAPLVTESVIQRAIDNVPSAWFRQGFPDGSVIEPERMYEALLINRLQVRRDFEALADIERFSGICVERITA